MNEYQQVANLINNVGDRICHMRVQRGWTQHRLAAKAGVAQMTVSRLEGGQGTHLHTFLLIVAALDVSPMMFFEGMNNNSK